MIFLCEKKLGFFCKRILTSKEKKISCASEDMCPFCTGELSRDNEKMENGSFKANGNSHGWGWEREATNKHKMSSSQSQPNCPRRKPGSSRITSWITVGVGRDEFGLWLPSQELWKLLLTTYVIRGKVMFSEVYVCLSTVGGGGDLLYRVRPGRSCLGMGMGTFCPGPLWAGPI